MTEQEWRECTDPGRMLEFLRGKVSDRKLRLFGCACCRRVWDLLSDKYCRKALTVAERYADGEVSAEKLGFAWGDARRSAQVAHRQRLETAEGAAMWAVSMLCEADIGRALAAVIMAARCEAYPGDAEQLAEAQRAQVTLLRDIFGNPFRPPRLDLPSVLAWNDGAVASLAEAAYVHRSVPGGELDPERLSILADALEDASCSDADILGHLRGPGPHVRGCGVVDLVRDVK
jgi:hypothetical protein